MPFTVVSRASLYTEVLSFNCHRIAVSITLVNQPLMGHTLEDFDHVQHQAGIPDAQKHRPSSDRAACFQAATSAPLRGPA